MTGVHSASGSSGSFASSCGSGGGYVPTYSYRYDTQRYSSSFSGWEEEEEEEQREKEEEEEAAGKPTGWEAAGRRPSSKPPGSQPASEHNTRSAPEQTTPGCKWCTPVILFAIMASMLLFGLYFPEHIEAGLGYSRLATSKSLFVREVEVKQDEGTDGAYLYSFDRRPSLQEYTNVTFQFQESLGGLRHQEWALWMNKGSRMTVRYDVNLGCILFAILQGEESFRSWVQDPSNQATRQLKGKGSLEFPISDSDDYYFAFGNTDGSSVEVSLQLDASLKQYNTDEYVSRCSLNSGDCKLKLPSFWLITTPAKAQRDVDLWRFTIIRKTRWITYLAGYGFIALLVGGVLLVCRFCRKEVHHKKNEDDSNVKKSKDDADVNEKSPLILEKQNISQDTGASTESDTLCVICMEAEKDSFYDPCGHSVTCYSCGLRTKESGNASCPICRASIGKVRKLYKC